MEKPSQLKAILDDLKKGQLVLVTDSHDREDEADLLMAAEFITTEKINFFLNHARGLITNPISSAIAKSLQLPLMVPENAGTLMTAFTVSIDAVSGTHTGISSKDRSVTIKKLSHPEAVATDFERPGHVFPLIAHDLGVLAREGHTEAAIDLMKLAGLNHVAVLCETLNENGNALKGEELQEFARTYKIKIVSIEEIKKTILALGKTV
jgi:3,4-dihydroxy 2-butanone 4-phosphate synthase/GTP cyclohydrolase II